MTSTKYPELGVWLECGTSRQRRRYSTGMVLASVFHVGGARPWKWHVWTDDAAKNATQEGRSMTRELAQKRADAALLKGQQP